MSFFKVPRWESETYLAWVRTLPCANCGSAYKSHAHHRIGHGRCSTMKVDDFEAMPLCHACHSGLHNDGWRDWESEASGNKAQHILIVDTFAQAIRQGVFAFDKKTARGIAR